MNNTQTNNTLRKEWRVVIKWDGANEAGTIVNQYNETICEFGRVMRSGKWACSKEELKNAHLIAANPQLVEFVRDLINEPERMSDEDEREKTIFEAKELLNKAEGRA